MTQRPEFRRAGAYANFQAEANWLLWLASAAVAVAAEGAASLLSFFSFERRSQWGTHRCDNRPCASRFVGCLRLLVPIGSVPNAIARLRRSKLGKLFVGLGQGVGPTELLRTYGRLSIDGGHIAISEGHPANRSRFSSTLFFTRCHHSRVGGSMLYCCAAHQSTRH